MNELDLKLTGHKYKDNVLVKIDGTPIKFRKDKNGNLICKYRTKNESVRIEVLKLLDVGGIFWFVTQLFFFIITIFGLLDIHYKENCYVIDFSIDVALEEKSALKLRLITPKDTQTAIEIKTDLPVTEFSNAVYLDKKAKKRITSLKFAKILLAIATIAVFIVVMITRFK